MAVAANLERDTAMTATAKSNVTPIARQAGIIIERESGQESSAPAKLVSTALQAWALKKQIAELEAQLEPLNATLTKALQDASLVIAGVCRAIVASSTRVTVADAEKLRAVLGERYDDLVETRETARPLDKLLEIASDGDHPLQASVNACLKVGKSTSVRMVAEK